MKFEPAKIHFTLEEVQVLLIDYVKAKGHKPQFCNVEKHIEGTYDEAEQVIDGFTVTLEAPTT